MKTTRIQDVRETARQNGYAASLEDTGEFRDQQALSVPDWPALDPMALTGVAGDIVNAIGPYTEADKVTLLIHLLSEFSCMVGRVPHIRLDGDYSPLLFWPVAVGDTSKS